MTTEQEMRKTARNLFIRNAQQIQEAAQLLIDYPDMSADQFVRTVIFIQTSLREQTTIRVQFDNLLRPEVMG